MSRNVAMLGQMLACVVTYMEYSRRKTTIYFYNIQNSTKCSDNSPAKFPGDTGNLSSRLGDLFPSPFFP